MTNSVLTKTTDVNGVLEITSEGWDGRILRMSRNIYDVWRKNGNQPNTAAVYALYVDHFDKQSYGNELYIGHADIIDNRLNNHVAKKDYWTAVLIFTSKSDWLNVAITKNIEHRFIELAKHANRYDVKNGNNGGTSKLSKEDNNRFEEYVKNVPDILAMAGLDIFQRNYDGLYELSETLHYDLLDYWSAIRIVDHKENVIEIVKGSKILYLDKKLVDEAKMNGVEHDPDNHIHHFLEDVHYELDKNNIAKMLCKKLLSNWVSKNGTSLKDALKRIS